MENFYSAEVNVQILIALMKAHGVRKVIVSPGTTNVAFGASVRQDPFFELYSSVDERSAAYMACGMAAESGEPVALSCTGATAARNYLPGLTEAFYRKLPVLAITSSQRFFRLGNLSPQFTDRTSPPKDSVRTSLFLPLIRDNEEAQAYVVKVNAALLELRRGGSVHINLETSYSSDFSVKTLPQVPIIRRYRLSDALPKIPANARVAVIVNSHAPWSETLTAAVDTFCEKYNGIVICDHTSNYNGKYKIFSSLLSSQSEKFYSCQQPDLLIHIGEISGAYFSVSAPQVWRVNREGELQNTFNNLRCVFEMTDEEFFSAYANNSDLPQSMTFYEQSRADYENLRAKIPDVPFSNIWLAKVTAHRLPPKSVLHLGILNSLRAWNFFDCDATVTRFSNVGGFGIDGCVSTLLGASLVAPNKIFFGVIGDLAFFYDLNASGNRHVGNNLRILLVNNGRGTEFRMYNHYAARFGEDADPFIAAAGHFGNQSRDLVRHFAQDLGFEYLSASNKQEYLQHVEHFVSPEKFSKPILFEVFTNPAEESDALYKIMHLVEKPKPIQNSAQEKIYFPKPPFFCGEDIFAGEVLNAFGQYEILRKLNQIPFGADKIVVLFSKSYPQLKNLFEANGLREEEHFTDGRKLFTPPHISFTPQKTLPSSKSNLLPPKKAQLGFGVMRMPQLENGQYNIDECVRMIDEYMRGEFCYFDTHPHYCHGLSQSIVRELVVKRYPREKFLLADKMPWPINHPSEYEKIFAAELQDCAVKYFDYYLLHALSEEYYQMHERMGGFEFLKQLKAQGFARRIGFSFHDKPEVLEKILTAHPEVEFVQLQINYFDWEDPFFQSRKLYETAKKFGKQILVMEPIKGGTLANLETFQISGGLDRKTFAAMALKFVSSLDVDIILSGMTLLEHVVENRLTLSKPAQISEDDKKIYSQILDVLKKARLIPCTACRYCVAECPKKIPIPEIFALRNTVGDHWESDSHILGRYRGVIYPRCTFGRGKASDCINCGACARRCPQKIKIPEHMREASKIFEGK